MHGKTYYGFPLQAVRVPGLRPAVRQNSAGMRVLQLFDRQRDPKWEVRPIEYYEQDGRKIPLNFSLYHRSYGRRPMHFQRCYARATHEGLLQLLGQVARHERYEKSKVVR